MGGIISITIRLPDGTEYRTQRWTNPFPYWFKDVRFLQKDVDYIKSYLKGWVDMKEDYEKKEFKLPYTRMYFPSEGLCPIGYGLWVIDVQKNEILDCFQDYTTLTDATIYIHDCYSDSRDPENIARINALLTAKKLKTTEVDLALFDNFDHIKQTYKNRYYLNATLDITPFKLTRYECSQADLALAHIKQLGFQLNETEEHKWQDDITRWKKEAQIKTLESQIEELRRNLK